VLEDADEAICISDQVARDFERMANSIAAVRQTKIGRLHMGADIAATLPSSGICFQVRQLAEQMRSRPTVLMVGTIEPRKGYDVAIAAFEHLWRTSPSEAPDLVIVGKPGWKTTPLQQYLRLHGENGKRLHWLDGVSDEGLCLFYESCCGVVLTSHGEGFGLPLMEAALHRRHILVRDLPVFREQGLPNVLYFQSDGPVAIGERILELVHAGVARPTFLPTWSESVDRLLRAMSLTVPQISQAEPVLRKAS
jgi:glycosyltransferase involved in cell wall biosynthesis